MLHVGWLLLPGGLWEPLFAHWDEAACREYSERVAGQRKGLCQVLPEGQHPDAEPLHQLPRVAEKP